MRSAAALLLLLAAGVAGAGELIEFRAPDGRVGMVDHPSKLPPGAIVVERRAKAKHSEDPAAAKDDFAPTARGRDAFWDQLDRAGTPPPAARSGDTARCLRFGLPSDCAAGEIRRAESWCDKGRSARSRIERAEQSLELAEEALDDCETGALRGGYCSRRRFLAAESELESSEQALGHLEEACRSAGCLPGWVRGDCDS